MPLWELIRISREPSFWCNYSALSGEFQILLPTWHSLGELRSLSILSCLPPKQARWQGSSQDAASCSRRKRFFLESLLWSDDNTALRTSCLSLKGSAQESDRKTGRASKHFCAILNSGAQAWWLKLVLKGCFFRSFLQKPAWVNPPHSKCLKFPKKCFLSPIPSSNCKMYQFLKHQSWVVFFFVECAHHWRHGLFLWLRFSHDLICFTLIPVSQSAYGNVSRDADVWDKRDRTWMKE